MVDSPESGSPSLRPEEAAAIASASLVLAAPFMVAALLRIDQPERAVVIGWVSGPVPEPLLAWFARAATSIGAAAPFAALAAWRAHAHTRRWRTGPRRLWRAVAGRAVAEPIVAGALLPLVVLLPVVATRGLVGVAYASSCGLIGALVGLAVGLLIAAVTAAVVFASSRLSSGR